MMLKDTTCNIEGKVWHSKSEIILLFNAGLYLALLT